MGENNEILTAKLRAEVEDFLEHCTGSPGGFVRPLWNALLAAESRNAALFFAAGAPASDDLEWRDSFAGEDAALPAFWACTGCGSVVEPQDVTFQRRHDLRASGCGGHCIIKTTPHAALAEYVSGHVPGLQRYEISEDGERVVPNQYGGLYVREDVLALIKELLPDGPEE
jgi:hypothetical protein